MGLGSQRALLARRLAAAPATACATSRPTSCCFAQPRRGAGARRRPRGRRRAGRGRRRRRAVRPPATWPRSWCRTRATATSAAASTRSRELVDELPVPVVVKETGCGFAPADARAAARGGRALRRRLGRAAAPRGRGSRRCAARARQRELGETLRDWGIPTAASLVFARRAGPRAFCVGRHPRRARRRARAGARRASAAGLALPFLRAYAAGGEAAGRRAGRAPRRGRARAAAADRRALAGARPARRRGALGPTLRGWLERRALARTVARARASMRDAMPKAKPRERASVRARARARRRSASCARPSSCSPRTATSATSISAIAARAEVSRLGGVLALRRQGEPVPRDLPAHAAAVLRRAPAQARAHRAAQAPVRDLRRLRARRAGEPRRRSSRSCAGSSSRRRCAPRCASTLFALHDELMRDVRDAFEELSARRAARPRSLSAAPSSRCSTATCCSRCSTPIRASTSAGAPACAASPSACCAPGMTADASPARCAPRRSSLPSGSSRAQRARTSRSRRAGCRAACASRCARSTASRAWSTRSATRPRAIAWRCSTRSRRISRAPSAARRAIRCCSGSRRCCAAHALPREPFARLIEANRCRPAAGARSRRWEELLAYCALSANPVGELVLHVFGAATPERVALSDHVCSALQVIEHCQDVAEDRARGRVYLPAEDLARARLRAPRDLAAPALAAAAPRASRSRSRARARCSVAGAPLVAQLRGRRARRRRGLRRGRPRRLRRARARAGFDAERAARARRGGATCCATALRLLLREGARERRRTSPSWAAGSPASRPRSPAPTPARA